MIKTSSNNELKTSKDWYELAKVRKNLVIYTPNGWDKDNYEYSFNEELINQAEFNKRVLKSTCFYLRKDDNKITTCDAVHIDILCQKNNTNDIDCGGPVYLGYDFYIEMTQNISEIKETIRSFLRKYHRPFISFKETIEKDCNIGKVWAIETIEECIKDNEPC